MHAFDRVLSSQQITTWSLLLLFTNGHSLSVFTNGDSNDALKKCSFHACENVNDFRHQFLASLWLSSALENKIRSSEMLFVDVYRVKLVTVSRENCFFSRYWNMIRRRKKNSNTNLHLWRLWWCWRCGRRWCRLACGVWYKTCTATQRKRSVAANRKYWWLKSKMVSMKFIMTMNQSPLHYLCGRPVDGKSVFRGTVGLGAVVATCAGVDANTTEPPSEPCRGKNKENNTINSVNSMEKFQTVPNDLLRSSICIYENWSSQSPIIIG